MQKWNYWRLFVSDKINQLHFIVIFIHLLFIIIILHMKNYEKKR